MEASEEVVLTSNPGYLGADAGGSQVRGQPGQLSKTLFPNKEGLGRGSVVEHSPNTCKGRPGGNKEGRRLNVYRRTASQKAFLQVSMARAPAPCPPAHAGQAPEGTLHSVNGGDKGRPWGVLLPGDPGPSRMQEGRQQIMKPRSLAPRLPGV